MPTKDRKSNAVATVRSGPVHLSIYRDTARQTYFFKWIEGDRERWKRNKDLEQLKTEARKVAKRIASGTLDITDLQPNQLAVVREVIRRGITLADLERLDGLPSPTSLGDAVEQFLAAKRAAVGKSERNVRTLSGILNAMVTEIGKSKHISAVEPKEIDRWLRKAKTPRTRKNWRGAAVTLFRWCRDKELLPQDRRTAAERSDRVKVELGTVEVWTPKELKKLLENVPPDYLAWICIQAFAGVRSGELFPEQRLGCNKDPLRWENVRLDRDDPFIEVVASCSKTGERRLVPVCETLKAWLLPLHKGAGRVCPAKSPSRRNHGEETIIEALERTTGMAWKRNGLRHSFGSYRTALCKNIERVALEMGNSPSVVRRHYHEAQTDADAEDWFGMTPDKIERKLRVTRKAS